jgi:hypothetical protein
MQENCKKIGKERQKGGNERKENIKNEGIGIGNIELEKRKIGSEPF